MENGTWIQVRSISATTIEPGPGASPPNSSAILRSPPPPPPPARPDVPPPPPPPATRSISTLPLPLLTGKARQVVKT